MFFLGKGCFIIQKTHSNLRKEDVFPARYQKQSHREGIFQLTSARRDLDLAAGRLARGFNVKKRGSLTLETALVLPLFLFAILAMLQFAVIQHATSALLAGAQETVREMAVYAYIQNMGVTAGDGVPAKLLRGGLSAAWASGQIQEKSGVGSELGNVSLLQSDFGNGTILDLVGTFQPAHTYTVLPVKKAKGIFRARVRAWTGRTETITGQDRDQREQEKEEQTVYVAETGKVYHTDPECTHIRLSIRTVPESQLKGLRNASGGKYHRCEKCRGSGNGTVYISPYGDKYHTSLSCSGLKRTISSVPLSEAEHLKACSKCGKK